MELILKRVGQSDKGTFGVLWNVQVPFLLTMELPWKNNTTDISCIPLGSYICKRVQSPKFGMTFEVTGVPGRDHVLFHKGNYLVNTHGCILVGEKFEGPFAAPYIEDSGHAFNELMMLLKDESEFVLHIIGV